MPLNKPGRSGGILPYLFLYIPVVWAALLIAQSLGNGLPELLTNLTAALQTPLKIRWTEHSLMSILACTGAPHRAAPVTARNTARHSGRLPNRSTLCSVKSRISP